MDTQEIMAVSSKASGWECPCPGCMQRSWAAALNGRQIVGRGTQQSCSSCPNMASQSDSNNSAFCCSQHCSQCHFISKAIGKCHHRPQHDSASGFAIAYFYAPVIYLQEYLSGQFGARAQSCRTLAVGVAHWEMP